MFGSTPFFLQDPFDVKKRGSSYFTEFRAGLTTFLAMAYILPVNSGMLSLVIPGMREQLVCATALAAFLWMLVDGDLVQLSLHVGTWHGHQRLFHLHHLFEQARVRGVWGCNMRRVAVSHPC